jgi:DNA-binding response OmpR family regulator
MKKKYEEILDKSTILLVDDNENLRKRFKEVLSIYVDTIYEASNGEDAIELYNKYNPNILITDVKMPIMGGLMLTRLVRKLNNDIPIVIISAYHEKELLLDFISLNLIEYLVKPVDFNQLSNVLSKCAKVILDKGLIEVQLTKICTYSYSKKSLLIDNKIISLTAKEISFLELLIKNKNKLVTKNEVEYTVYNSEEMTVSAINNLVLRVRKKIGSSKVIVTINELGFMFIKQ